VEAERRFEPTSGKEQGCERPWGESGQRVSTYIYMAFRSIRDHSHMGFADSFTQDMDFWRQRIDKETTRIHTPSSFSQNALRDLPKNPFRDSAGMLLGQGVSPRRGDTQLGVLAPDLAAYRAAVTKTPWNHELPRRFPSTPHGLVSLRAGLSSSAGVETRAARGALALQPMDWRPVSRPPPAYETNLLIEAPNNRICASLRRGMPRARLDARMYAPSPG